MAKHRYTRKQWAQWEVQQIIDLYGAGHRIRYISNYFKVSPNALYKTLQRHYAKYNMATYYARRRQALTYIMG